MKIRGSNSECRKKNIPTKKNPRHVLALFRTNSWKRKCYWPDFYLNGLKPVYQLGVNHRFGHRTRPLRLMRYGFGVLNRPTIKPLKPGVILRPVETWYEAIVIGKDIKLVLSNGDCYLTQAIGFEMGGNLNAGLLVNEIPSVSNEDLLGAKLYVLAE